MKHILYLFKRHIQSIKKDTLQLEINIIFENLEMPSISLLKENGLRLDIQLTEKIRQKCYQVLLGRLRPYSSSIDTICEINYDSLEELIKKIEEKINKPKIQSK